MNSVAIGAVFGRLTVTGPALPDRWSHRRVECVCSCGNTITIVAYDLTRRTGNTESCRCISTEITAQMNRRVKYCGERNPRYNAALHCVAASEVA